MIEQPLWTCPISDDVLKLKTIDMLLQEHLETDIHIYLHFTNTVTEMSALPAKPGLRLSVSEWHSNNDQLSATAQHERLISNVIRQEGRSLRNETNCKVGARAGGQTVSVG